METNERAKSREEVVRDQLDDCMLAIFGILERPVDYQWVRLYLPKHLDDVYRENILGSLSEATTWNFGTAANQIIVDRLGPNIEPAPLIGYQLTADKGEEAYEALLESVEANPQAFPHVQEVFDRYRLISQGSAS